jgi:hypothetical protein
MGRYLITIDPPAGAPNSENAVAGIEAGSDPVTVRNTDVVNEVWRDAAGVERSLVRYVTSQTSNPCFGSNEYSSTMNCRGSGGANQHWIAADSNAFGNMTFRDQAPSNWTSNDWGQPEVGGMPTTPAARVVFDNNGVASEVPDPSLFAINRLENLQRMMRAGDPGLIGDEGYGDERSSFSGPWSVNPANSVSVNWILSFPLKHIYFEERAFGNGTGIDPRAPHPGDDYRNRRPGLPVGVAWPSFCAASVVPRFWDRDEHEAFSFRVSPGGGVLKFCNEMNVLRLFPDPEAGGVPPYSPILLEKFMQGANFFFDPDITDGIHDIRGWAWLPIDTKGGAIGLSFTTRATADPDRNNGSITELKRGIDP